MAHRHSLMWRTPGRRSRASARLAFLLQRLIVARQGEDSKLAASIGRDVKGKFSPILYAAGIVLSFGNSRIDLFYAQII